MTSFLAAIDVMAVGPAMPSVVADLGGAKRYFLVFSVFLVASTVMVPIFGRLSDIYGRMKLLLLGIVLFLGGSALCGLAGSLRMLILFRGIQGLGAGSLMTLGFTMLADMYPLEQRAKMQGFLSGMWGLASLLGPLIGGFLTEHFSWRYVFYINLPVGVVAFLLIALTWRFEPKNPKPHRMDIAGACLFSLAMGSTLAGLATLAEREGGGTRAIVLLLVGILGAVCFLAVERRHPEPFVDLSLLRNRVFVGAACIGFFAAACLFAISAYGPMFIQGVVGSDPQEAGLALTPMTLSWVALSSLSGFLILRIGYRILVTAGTIFILLGYAALLGLSERSTWTDAALRFSAVGAGLGCIMAPMLIATQNAVARRQLGAATSMIQFLRSTGGSLALAVMGVLFAARLGPLESEIGFRAEEALHPKVRATLSPETLARLHDALASSIHQVFLVGALAAVLALGCTLLVPHGRARDLAAPSLEKAPGA